MHSLTHSGGNALAVLKEQLKEARQALDEAHQKVEKHKDEANKYRESAQRRAVRFKQYVEI